MWRVMRIGILEFRKWERAIYATFLHKNTMHVYLNLLPGKYWMWELDDVYFYILLHKNLKPLKQFISIIGLHLTMGIFRFAKQ